MNTAGPGEAPLIRCRYRASKVKARGRLDLREGTGPGREGAGSAIVRISAYNYLKLHNKKVAE